MTKLSEQMSNPTDKLDEAVERLKADRIRWLDNHPYKSGWMGTCADILTVCTALAELREKYEAGGCCTDCGYPVTIVRPGKYQCDHCESVSHFESTIAKLTAELAEAQENRPKRCT